jgi:diketogulonate reductase-like aldo/keto reductase
VQYLDLAESIGIDTLDTASGCGNSEQALGKVGIDNCQIITKTSSIKLCVDSVISDFYNSLEGLGLARVEGLLIHNIDDIKGKQLAVLFRKLNQLKGWGLVNKIGFSIQSDDWLKCKTYITQEMLKNGILVSNVIYICAEHGQV